MGDPIRIARFRFWLWLIRLIGVIVPRRLRADWRQEWEAELRHREAMLAEWERLKVRGKLDLLWRSTSAFWDALWMQTYRWEDAMIQDLRFGVRMLLKHKSFTAVAILSLGLGIGANTAIFQLLDATRLRMLPVKAPQELVEVRLADTKGVRGGGNRWPVALTNPIWEQIRERQQVFSGVFAWVTDKINLAPGGEVRNARVLFVSGDFFNTLGVSPALGRVITNPDDERGCGAPGLVISHEFWQREFGGDADVIGRKLTVADQSLDIIGVTPAGFFGLEVGRSFDLALPICSIPLIRGNKNMLSGTHWWVTVNGRLKPGCSLEQATANTLAISPGLFEATLPANYPPVNVKDYLGFKLIAIHSGSGFSQLREKYEASLWILLAIAGSVLLVACANLASLLLARASARSREIAVRQALGASRGRLIRQLLVESFLLAATGAVLGIGLSQVLSRFLVAFLSTTNSPIFLNLTPDWRVFGFAVELAILTCLLFGLAPAIRATRSEPGAAMKLGGRGMTANRERFSLRRALIVTQVAVSLVLVAGALLFSRSLDKLLTVDAGFRAEGVLIADIGYRRLNLARTQYPAFSDDLRDRIRAIPGVESVGVASGGPLGGSASTVIRMDDTDQRQAQKTNLNLVGPDYFKALQIPLLDGREFDSGDRADKPNVAIVNEAFARRFTDGTSPVGRRFRTEAGANEPEALFQIIGLVRDTKYGGLREEFVPIIYFARAQEAMAGPSDNYYIRTRLPQGEIVAAVNRLLNDINPGITVSFQGLKPVIEATLLRERLMATLSGFFGLLALLLASIGLYGVMSYGVASRTNEIGIRMALGAQPKNVRWLVMREALLLVIAGIAVGLPIIFAVTRLASTLLYGLTPTDPISLVSAAMLMLSVSMLAGYLPARRATLVDPMVALRCE